MTQNLVYNIAPQHHGQAKSIKIEEYLFHLGMHFNDNIACWLSVVVDRCFFNLSKGIPNWGRIELGLHK